MIPVPRTAKPRVLVKNAAKWLANLQKLKANPAAEFGIVRDAAIAVSRTPSLYACRNRRYRFSLCLEIGAAINKTFSNNQGARRLHHTAT